MFHGQWYLPLMETSLINFSGVASQRLKTQRHSASELEGHCKHKGTNKHSIHEGDIIKLEDKQKSNGVLREYTNTLDNDEQKKHKTR